MKFQFNLKLTAFLVSLFISLIMIILGNKNQYCLSFGFIALGLSLFLFVLYNDEKVAKTVVDLDNEIEDFASTLEDNATDNAFDEVDESAYALKQQYLRRKKIVKHAKKVKITFYLCAILFVVLGIVGIF